MSETTDTSAATSGEWETLARTAHAEGFGDDSEVALMRELLIFDLAGTSYAIPVERVREIVRLREITSIPRVPAWVLGVVALRGEVVQVVDLRMRLGLERREASRSTRIIVLHGDDEKITGMLVDAVHEVLRTDEDSIAPASGGEGGAVNEMCVRGEEFVSIVDVDRVLELRAD